MSSTSQHPYAANLLRTFISVQFVLSVLFATFFWIETAAVHSTFLQVTGTALTAFCLALAWSYRLLRRGDLTRSAQVAAYSTLAVTAVAPPLSPVGWGVLFMAIVISVAVGLPYLPDRERVRLLVASFLTAVIIGSKAIYLPELGASTATRDYVLTLSAMAICMFNVVTLLWLFSEHYKVILNQEEEARLRAEASALYNEGLAADLRKLIGAREDFLSVAGHELRTPLTALQMQVESLMRSAAALPAEPDVALAWKKRFLRAYRCIDRLTHLVDDLLDVSRIDCGKLELCPEQVDLKGLLGEVSELFQGALAASNSTLSVQVDGPIRGSWDKSRLEQVLTNLIGNAVKYGGGQPIEVRAQAVGDGLTLTVRDHGIGLPAVDRERIFGKFERAVAAHSYGGLGMGLWITRAIVEAHGGSIEAGNAPDGGAIFTVRLPLGAATTQVSPRRQPGGARHDRSHPAAAQAGGPSDLHQS